MENKNLIIQTYEDLEDEELIEIYRHHDAEAIEVLVQRYKKFVRKKIKSNFFIGADKEDLIQEGMIGLFKAICDYNPNKDATFKSFATLCVVRQISTAFKTATRQKHIPLNTSISLDSPIVGEEDESITLMDLLRGDEQENPETVMIGKEDVARFQTHMKETLSEFELKVLALHIQGQNYNEIADVMHKSVKSIDNALQRIKRKASEKINRSQKK
ncbi:MAG: RNA polymerase sporulation sigma factor SigH [Cellulosilyticaceae bacterium]